MSPAAIDEAADVLIVGAGASGAAVAWAVSGDTDARVVCLERGGWMEPRDYPTADPNWELRRLTDFNPNPSARRASTDYTIDDLETPIKPLMLNGVGGGTIMWSAHFPRLRPSDFRVRSLDGVAADWPITYEDLEPYYELNDEITGVAGVSGDPANPPRGPRQTPPLALGRGGDLMADALERLGWHWWPSDVATNSRPYGENRGACNYCGGMELGCFQMAKASTDLTYWPRAIENGVELRTDARVVEIAVDSNGRASGVSYIDGDGLPLTTLHYAVSENSLRILEQGTEKAAELLREAGATEVMVNHLPSQSGFNLMGTTRMGEDRASSVVDGWGRAHDVDNLFVVDGSTFVTSASVNPTSTIQALALRTGHHIAEELDELA